MFSVTSSFHLEPEDELRHRTMGHSDNSRSITVESTVAYGGFSIFCTSEQATALAGFFADFAASFVTPPFIETLASSADAESVHVAAKDDFDGVPF